MNKVFSLILLFITINITAQKLISGKVIDVYNKEPLIGVTIVNEYKKTGVYTDLNGHFKIIATSKLTFSYIGYKTKTLTLPNNNKSLTITLEPLAELLNEVEIIAKKNINDIDLRKATGAITTIKSQKLINKPTVNALQPLQGQVAGLTIRASGELGKPLKIRIRGISTLPIKTPTNSKLTDEQRELLDNKANQPLFVLDGQIISADAFATLNVNDIDEIKVLKDATANALYGVKASNGIIEITSKRGINGDTQYAFSFQQGITFKGKPNRSMMATEEKLAFERLSKNKATPGYYLSEAFIRKTFSGNPNIEQLVINGKQKLDSIKNINTNWFNELARISTYQSYNISTRGGNDTSKFYVSGNFSNHGGKFDGNEINRFTGRLNYEYNVSKNIYSMFNAGFGFSESKTPHGSTHSPTNLIYQLNPYEQKNVGKLISYNGYTFKELINQYNKTSDDNRFNFSANITAKLAKNLNIATVVGIDYLVNESLSIIPPTAYSEIIKGTPVNERGQVSKTKVVNTNLNTNTRLNYNLNLGKHNLSFSANMDYYKSTNDFIGITGHGLPSKLLSGAGINNSLTGATRAKTSSSKIQEATLGFGFSTLYDWNDKIDVYGSYKRDASSLLPSDKRWNTFWATGIGYTLSNESFLKNNSWLNRLKFRASYGVTASLAGISPSLAIPTFSYTTNSYLGIRDFSLLNLFNKDLRPEENTSINFGVDLQLFNIFNLTAEVYHRRTRDMLLTVSIPPSNGFTQQLKNVGVMDNEGLEISLNTTLIKNSAFHWNTSATFSYNRNKVVDLYDGPTLNVTNKEDGYSYPDYQEGQPTDIIYGLVSLGINPADGHPLFQRKDGNSFDGNTEKPNKEDFIVLGRATPPFTGGWFHNLSYKNWQLGLDIYYSFGGKAVHTNRSKVYSEEDVHKNLNAGQLNQTWFTIGDVNKTYPTLNLHTNQFGGLNNLANTQNISSTDFIRLNNVMLRYNFDNQMLQKISNGFIKNWGIYTQVSNVYTWTNFGGGDPESGNLQGSSQPILTFGTNITF
ncbi:SusC/RagA family TonB-linked outer membrane protein [Tenacibaculum ovolyticum]|uniref:SusC/RagA family TonB-linked outer membrane protein n=1 Tax=Tenacibaculum ovolyticum TaxID=104270 RepID=UPI0022F3EB5C|nr:SusC/RagA family TonB-linked outer membrane protein [Tenacibaculum ovolyticum]WBX77070.1 SusC/RagA family TonB-linked outer membrane protein [Tenacibaculum ovolyticum]